MYKKRDRTKLLDTKTEKDFKITNEKTKRGRMLHLTYDQVYGNTSPQDGK